MITQQCSMTVKLVEQLGLRDQVGSRPRCLRMITLGWALWPVEAQGARRSLGRRACPSFSEFVESTSRGRGCGGLAKSLAPQARR